MAAATPEIEDIYIGADMNAEYFGAYDEILDEYLNDGACTYELKDSDGTVLDSGTLEYQAASEGDYLAVIDGPTVTADLTARAIYTVEITFEQDEYHDFRVLKFRARKRGRR